MKRFIVFLSFLFLLLSATQLSVPACAQLPDSAKLEKLYREGNYKDAYQGYQRLLLSPGKDDGDLPSYLTKAKDCLERLGRISELDDLLESSVAAHPGAWNLLSAAAGQYADVSHQGYIVAGKFYRGYSRGGDVRYVDAQERDRVRAIQLYLQAIKIAKEEGANYPSLYLELAQVLSRNHNAAEAWKLQHLTDLSSLPDYEERNYRFREAIRTPAEADGSPVFFRLPKSWEEAKNDGERFRWALNQEAEVFPKQREQVAFLSARFWRDLYDVQTLAGVDLFGGDDNSKESEAYAVHTLAEDETIALLASGIKRFKLPDEFNFIKMLRELAGKEKTSSSIYQTSALKELAVIFENRRQYSKAAQSLQMTIEWEKPEINNELLQHLNQIVGAWGRFEPVSAQAAGRAATVDFSFRNAKSVSFKAYELSIEKLLGDIKESLKAKNSPLDYVKMDIARVGNLLVHKNELRYRGKLVASWIKELNPKPDHFDARINIKTPLSKAGAYLLSANVAGGNTSNIVLWINDTVIVKKPGKDGSVYFVADAENGKPISKAKLDFFGYREVYTEPKPGSSGRPSYNIVTKEFSENTNKQGLLVTKEQALGYQWLISAHAEPDRFAVMGFAPVWGGSYFNETREQTKVFFITDRPVYRPKQEVKIKIWIAQSSYGQSGDSPFANKSFTLQISNPKSEKILEKVLVADNYGGMETQLNLPEDASLGQYSLTLLNYSNYGSFRVEEYKKPEFEVSIEAPKMPVALGDAISAKISAKYYFGAPVTEARVKYKVLRTDYQADWHPPGAWDWLFGAGYWWFAYDYNWYPGWKNWGCLRPSSKWSRRYAGPPELVMENEVEIGKDGSVSIEIDSSLAKVLHGDKDQQYQITAEVTDRSRRTIVGSGEVLAARKPFQIYAWLEQGFYHTGDVIRANFQVQTLDRLPVSGEGKLKLFQASYDARGEVKEQLIQEWPLGADAQGQAKQEFRTSSPGQYRISFSLSDSAGRSMEGGYVFNVIGEDLSSSNYRFNDLEIIPDKKEYAPGDKVRLMINASRSDSAILLFVRPLGGEYRTPELLQLKGKSTIKEIEVEQADMPNFFVEAVAVSGGEVFSAIKELAVPPQNKVLNVEVVPSSLKYKPGEQAKVALRLSDLAGKPVFGSFALSVYDKAVEYISGGSNAPDIKTFFWKLQRGHRPVLLSSLIEHSENLVSSSDMMMRSLGVLGAIAGNRASGLRLSMPKKDRSKGALGTEDSAGAQFYALESDAAAEPAMLMDKEASGDSLNSADVSLAVAQVRREFADTAYWAGTLSTNEHGLAELSFKMPENLTEWKMQAWAMGEGVRVGQGSASVVTAKDILVRLQTPRFLVEKDEVVISANVHNYLKSTKLAKVRLELPGDNLKNEGPAEQEAEVTPGTDRRVDWTVRALKTGEAAVRALALTDEESDAVEMRFPVQVHGMLKTESYSGCIDPEASEAALKIKVPKERQVSESRLEIRYSPSLAAAMVDALPYLLAYPYGCTEQTLNRFLPAVVVQKTLGQLGFKLKDIRDKRTNLNAQEVGDSKERAKQWQRFKEEPVFDEDEAARIAKAGLERLKDMQLADGGWGWFSGLAEHSTPHMTAYVMHGLQVAKEAGVLSIDPLMFSRGLDWLKHYQAKQLQELENVGAEKKPAKAHPDDLDAFVYMVLADAGVFDAKMREFLFRDRQQLALYTKAMFGLALFKEEQKEKLEMLMSNIGQYLVQDEENQTSYLKQPDNWWYWYNSEYEALAYYLKLLSRVDPGSKVAPRIVKYLLNNRKHGTYWNSTRDTALVMEAFAEYLKTSGEAEPDLTLEILIDGKRVREQRITRENMFDYDNSLIIKGDALEAGEHRVELRKKGRGPVYFNAYMINFSLEDFIGKSGLEIKVNRNYFKLVRREAVDIGIGSRGQAVEQRVDKYQRMPLESLALLKSGDLAEIELEIDSKNDYEYLAFEDMKPAGFEPLELRSGYNANDLNAYVEYRDNRVVFFASRLPRGKRSLSYRMRAEIPGKFSALPTKASAMYAPELKANSDEFRVKVED